MNFYDYYNKIVSVKFLNLISTILRGFDYNISFAVDPFSYHLIVTII